MKITFLGTSCGVPQKDRYCSATLVESGGRAYLVDAGAPVTELMRERGMTPCDLSAVFITHMHGDHVGGCGRMKELAPGLKIAVFEESLEHMRNPRRGNHAVF